MMDMVASEMEIEEATMEEAEEMDMEDEEGVRHGIHNLTNTCNQLQRIPLTSGLCGVESMFKMKSFLGIWKCEANDVGYH